jgi:hypothetical protein
MIKKWLSANDVAQLLLEKSRSIRRRAKRESWPCQTRATRGGQEQIYPLADLSEDVQLAYAESLKTTLEALQNELKPLPKTPVKHVIDGYKGMEAPQKT